MVNLISLVFRFPKLVEELNSPVVDLSVGLMHVVALTKDGKLFGWGKNDQNQLGKSEIYCYLHSIYY